MRNYIRNRYILLMDFLAIIFATILTYVTVFAGEAISYELIISSVGTYIVSTMAVFFISKVYMTAWSYVGTTELIHFFKVNFIAVVLMFFINEILRLVGVFETTPRRMNFVISILSILEMTLIRIFAKEYHKSRGNRAVINIDNSEGTVVRTLIIGAGDAARILISNTQKNRKVSYELVGLIDDDLSKMGKIFCGLRVLGTRDDIVRICDKLEVDKIILAIPSAYAEERKQILEICHRTKCDVKTIPGMDELLDSSDNIVRDVRIEDLLDRDPINLDNSKISELVSGKTVLVTGGGGSIGSELCRQIMRFSPKTLVIVDIYENNAYDIQMELNEKYPDNKPTVLIASVRDKERMSKIFAQYRPQIVFHAAAHKHVPLMEVSPAEAIKNNIFGTYNLACMSDEYNVDKFVMISTDKAVNPTNIMGASKRFCEMIIQCMEQISSTDFVAVRFGNVLGSNGSVIPLFKRQIAKGGPVKVTHKDIIRYFMTIPEAAQLVIQAACYANGGEIFILDMGKPVKIYTLAENIIRLSGYTPHVDIKIEITGLRPGEKLYEELLMNEEGLTQTEHKKIFVGRPEFVSPDELEIALKMLNEVIDLDDDNKIRDVFEKVVPTYIRDNESFNRRCKETSVN